MNLGQVKIGDARTVQLKLVNDGMRLIYGSVTIENGSWLALGSGAGAPQKAFSVRQRNEPAGQHPGQTASRQQQAPGSPADRRIERRQLRRQYQGRSSGQAVPFGALAGARSPRQVAEKAKANPKESAALFVSGGVAQWYKENGWQYPVKGQSAEGLAPSSSSLKPWA